MGSAQRTVKKQHGGYRGDGRHLWQKGECGNPAGRKKGSLNRRTLLLLALQRSDEAGLCGTYCSAGDAILRYLSSLDTVSRKDAELALDCMRISADLLCGVKDREADKTRREQSA